MPARSLTPLLRNTVAYAQDWQCKSCRAKLPPNFDVDHVVPRWKKGGHALDNLQALCHKCHGEKNHVEMLERLHGIVRTKPPRHQAKLGAALVLKRNVRSHRYNTRSRGGGARPKHPLLG